LLSGLGILIYSGALMACGVKQGMMLNDASASFPEIIQSSLMFIRVSTLGDVAMLLGSLVFLFNIGGLLFRFARAGFTAAWTENTKTVEVSS
jgi:cbb3-type cytochrome oxidase subunit 1